MKNVIQSTVIVLTLMFGQMTFAQETSNDELPEVRELIRQGQKLSAMEKHEEAFLAFDKATSLNPHCYDLLGMKAIELARLKRFDDALACINKAIYMSQNNHAIFYKRACIYCLKGDKENALADLKKSFERMPQLKICARIDTHLLSLWQDDDFMKATE